MVIAKKSPTYSKSSDNSSTEVRSAASTGSSISSANTATGAAISKVVSSTPVATTATKTSAKPNVSAIADRAYYIWKNEGCPDGRSMRHWLQAEKELSGR